MRVAFTTFAILLEPYGHARVQEFDDRTPHVFRAAEESPGFVARAVELDQLGGSNFTRDWGAWGAFDVPRFYTLGREAGNDQRASTLSVWRDLQSVFDFVYSGLHLSALKERESWFKKPEWPTYACWWIDDAHIPTWREACNKLEHLHDHGASPHAFDFRTCFDAAGRPATLKRSFIAG
jgi:hypothetical protein